jgi:hypothetical protein
MPIRLLSWPRRYGPRLVRYTKSKHHKPTTRISSIYYSGLVEDWSQVILNYSKKLRLHCFVRSRPLFYHCFGSSVRFGSFLYLPPLIIRSLQLSPLEKSRKERGSRRDDQNKGFGVLTNKRLGQSSHLGYRGIFGRVLQYLSRSWCWCSECGLARR